MRLVLWGHPLAAQFLPPVNYRHLLRPGEALVTSSTAALVADICQERHFGTAMGTFGTIL